MKILTLEPFDRNPPNVVIDVSDKRGEQLIAKGLAKAAPVPEHKIAEPSEDPANPSQAAGEEPTSSSSRAARPSPRKTATRSAAGAPKKRAGRPRKAPSAG